MKKTLLIAFLIGISSFSWGQSYKTGIGVKGGYPGYGGINLKHDFGSLYGDFTVSGGSRYGGRGYFNFTAIAEKQQTLSGNFDWYVGLGGYIDSWRDDYYYHDKYYNNGFAFGALAVIGIEYTFSEIPINIGAEVGPVVNFAPYFGTGFGGALALRFVLK